MSKTASDQVQLTSLKRTDVDQLMPIMKAAFDASILNGIGKRDESLVPSASDLLETPFLDDMDAYKILLGERTIGGVVVEKNLVERRNRLEMLFLDPKQQSKGIGQKVWNIIEDMYQNVDVWETETPAFSEINVHFYVNRCGFHVVEVFNKWHRDPNHTDDGGICDHTSFRFEKWAQWRHSAKPA